MRRYSEEMRRYSEEIRRYGEEKRRKGMGCVHHVLLPARSKAEIEPPASRLLLGRELVTDSGLARVVDSVTIDITVAANIVEAIGKSNEAIPVHAFTEHARHPDFRESVVEHSITILIGDILERNLPPNVAWVVGNAVVILATVGLRGVFRWSE